MSEFVIVSDSSTDFTVDMVEETGVQLVPLRFVLEGNTYKNLPDNSEMDPHFFYEKLRSGSVVTTSQANSEEFVEYFEPYLEKGTDILYIAFSSGLSGTYQSACIARDDLKEKYPDRKINVVDSRSASLGQGLLVYKAAMLKKDGRDIDYITDWVEHNKLHLCHWFTVDDLFFLKRGGRVSGATALVGTMLGIKPVLHMDDEGHLIPMSKVRGRKASLDALVKRMEESAIAPQNQTVFISHGDCLEDAEYVAEKVREKFHCEDIRINYVGPVIGSHSGPGTLALFFIGNER